MIICLKKIPDSKVHGANMGPTCVLSAPDRPHVGTMNLAIREMTSTTLTFQKMIVEGEKVFKYGEPTVEIEITESEEGYDNVPPKDYLKASVILLFVCFWVFPVGIMTLVQSLRTRDHVAGGDLEKARELSVSTYIWCIVTGILGGFTLLMMALVASIITYW